MIEANHEHDVSTDIVADYHVPEEAPVVAYVEEFEAVFQCITLYEQTDAVRRLRLKPAMLYVQDLVEETAYVEAETASVLRRYGFGIFSGFDPATV